MNKTKDDHKQYLDSLTQWRIVLQHISPDCSLLALSGYETSWGRGEYARTKAHRDKLPSVKSPQNVFLSTMCHAGETNYF